MKVKPLQNTHRKTHFLAWLAVLAMSCGGQTPKDEIARSPESLAKDAVKSALPESKTKASDKFIEFTIKRDKKTIDFLFLNEVNAAFGAQPLLDRFSALADAFAGRLAMTTDDVRAAVGPASVIPKGTNATRAEAAGLYLPETGAEWIFTDRNLVMPGVDAQGNATENFFFRTRMIRNAALGGYAYRPLSALKVVLDERAQATGFMRENAHLSVFFRSFGDEGSEKMEPVEIINLLKTVKGDNWSLTIISPPAEPCIYNQTNAAQTPGTTAAPRQEKLLKLVAAAGRKARFISICDSNLRELAQQAMVESGNTDAFTVTLPEKVMWSSIRVENAGHEVVNWDYTPGDTKLYLPGFLPNGVTVKIFYETDDGSKPNTVDPNKFKLPVIGERQISPEERLFLQDINPLVVQNCGCHNNVTPNFLNNFAVFRANKDTIRDQINGNMMPQNQPAGGPFYKDGANGMKILNFITTSLP